MMYLDLNELDSLFDGFWFWSARRPAPAWFRRADHWGSPAQDLASSIRDLVESKTGRRPEGAVRLLTHMRYFGYCFNPISIYYCHGRDGELEHVVLEVSNTPWKERHCYVLPAAAGRTDCEFDKAFHVSPFLPMDMRYRCLYGPPGERLRFALENRRDGSKVFDAHLDLARQPINHRNLARCLMTDPLLTLRVTTLIHWQAVKLWSKRTPFFAHPRKVEAARTNSAVPHE
jgi:DUF1365 family protein